jgi:putative transposase
MKKRFDEKQIIAILKEQESGVPTAEVCRKYGISPASFYKWKAKFGGMDASDAQKLKALETENAKLKRLLADAELDKLMLKEVLSKKW